MASRKKKEKRASRLATTVFEDGSAIHLSRIGDSIEFFFILSKSAAETAEKMGLPINNKVVPIKLDSGIESSSSALGLMLPCSEALSMATMILSLVNDCPRAVCDQDYPPIKVLHPNAGK